MPLCFFESLGIFIPKGAEEDDQNDLCRFGEDTRPLSLKDTDNKLIGTVTNKALTPTLSRSVVAEQRGFTAGRSLLSNVVDRDAMARIASCRTWGLDPDHLFAKRPHTVPARVGLRFCLPVGFACLDRTYTRISLAP